MENKEDLISHLKLLPTPLVGSIAFDSRFEMNLRDSCIEMLVDVMNITQPKEILEFGCHAMHSSLLLLYFSTANLTSVDIGHTWISWEHGYLDWNKPGGQGLRYASSVINYLFPGRFRFILGDSSSIMLQKKISDRKYDLLFCDGNHDYDYVYNDIQTAIKMKIPYVLLDDFTTNDKNDERVKAAYDSNLVLVKDYPNIHNAANIGCGLFKMPIS